MLNTSDVAGRPGEASCRRGGQHSQQRVRFTFRLRCGGVVLSSGHYRLAWLKGNQKPCILKAEVQQTDDVLRVRLHFACESEPLDVTPPPGWDEYLVNID